jgi:hypothetical protein
MLYELQSKSVLLSDKGPLYGGEKGLHRLIRVVNPDVTFTGGDAHQDMGKSIPMIASRRNSPKG